MTKRIELVNMALGQYGHMEVKGAQDNPEIVKYFHKLGFKGPEFKDEMSWCAAFVNWCLVTIGLSWTKSLSARSFLDYGKPTNSPKIGDIVVFWRGSHPDELIPGTLIKKGHVAIFIRSDDKHVYCLGGNQSNMVCISAYDKSQVLGYRQID